MEKIVWWLRQPGNDVVFEGMANMRFTVTTEGRNTLDLAHLCESFANQLWIPDHLTPDQAAEYAMDYFRRSVQDELRMLVICPAQ